MRTDLKAGTLAVLSGGAVYWMVIIRPNASDDWEPIIMGNLQSAATLSYSYTWNGVAYPAMKDANGTSDCMLWRNKLASIEDIDQSINIISDQLTNNIATGFSIINADDSVDGDMFVGRACEIRFGFGSTMNAATATDLIFTGKIKSSKIGDKKLSFTCAGNFGAWDVDVGEKLTDESGVDDNWVGKILPIVNGVWTDEAAYAPGVNAIKKQSHTIRFGSTDVVAGAALYVYDKTLNRKFAVQQIDADGNVMYTQANNETIAFKDSGAILESSMSGNENVSSLKTTGIYSLDYTISNDSEPSSPSIIMIGSEQMLITDVDYGTFEVFVCRGWNDTKITNHGYGEAIKIITEKGEKSYICEDYFYPVTVAGSRKVILLNTSFSANGNFRGIVSEGQNAETFDISYKSGISFLGSYVSFGGSYWQFDLLFQAPGIECFVENDPIIGIFQKYITMQISGVGTLTNKASGTLTYFRGVYENLPLSTSISTLIANCNSSQKIISTEQTDLAFSDSTYVPSSSGNLGIPAAPLSLDLTSGRITLADLLSKRLSVAIGITSLNYFNLEQNKFDIDINKISLKVRFKVPSDKVNSYWRGTAGDSADSQAGLVGSIVQEIFPYAGLATTAITDDERDEINTLRSDWKLATLVYCGE
jgi:hypothetical protein